MKIYMVSDDWQGDITYFLSRENAETARRKNFEEFRDTQESWHAGNVQDDDFYILEYNVEDA